MTDQTKEALKRCPFCGSRARLSYGSDGEVVNAQCVKWGSGCMGAGANKRHDADAIAAWNRRADAVRIQALESAIQQAIQWLGPEAASCLNCTGCRIEWEEALKALCATGLTYRYGDAPPSNGKEGG